MLQKHYTESMPDVFKAAGISFDFSGSHICKLAEFVEEELEKLRLRCTLLLKN